MRGARRGLQRSAIGDAIATRREPLTLPLVLVYTLWILLLFEPEWWLADLGAPGALRRIPTMLFPLVGLMVLVKNKRGFWYWPMALFLLSHVIMLPWVPNRGYAMIGIKWILYFYVFLLATVVVIDTGRKALAIITLYTLHFAWWAFHGFPYARVSWHPLLGNEDAFGPLMVLGAGFAYYFAASTRSFKLRVVAWGIAALCVTGVVMSFARGAVLSAALVAIVVWVRSPRKGQTFLALLLAAVVFGVSSVTLFKDNAFWVEMGTVAHGIDDDTGSDRWDLWKAGWRVFLQRPFFGVGPLNVGPYAAQEFAIEGLTGNYQQAERIYDRPLHNIFIQILSEEGLLGAFAFIALLYDFFSRNWKLRRRRSSERWRAIAGGHFDLGNLSRALELGMIGYLACGFFYDLIYIHWFFSIITVNLVLSFVTSGDVPGRPAVKQPSRRRRGARASMPPAPAAPATGKELAPRFGFTGIQ